MAVRPSPRTALRSARKSSLEDRFENMGAKLVNEVASKTSDKAGDGTTTATVLAREIFREGLRNITSGANPTAVRRGIDKAVAAAVDHLRIDGQTGERLGRHRPRRRDQRQQRSGDRQAHRRGHGEGRQGRRDHGRGRQDGRNDLRGRGRHAVRQGLPVAVLHQQPGHDDRRVGGRPDPDSREEDQQHPRPDSALGEGGPHRQAAVDYCRGRRGRGPHDPGGEQAPRRAQPGRREGPRLRRPPQGPAGRHRHSHCRHR